MTLIFHIWRQKSPDVRGKIDVGGQMVRYECSSLNEDMSMLEALDVLNEELIQRGEDPVTFEHDCREGICGSCGFMINGIAHGPIPKTTVCQLSLRHFKNGEQLYLEPWRAAAFPVLRDLMVDRRQCLRPDYFFGRLCIGIGGQRARRQRYPGIQRRRRPGHGCRRVYRLRSLRGGVSHRFGGVAVYRQPRSRILGLLPQGQPERATRVRCTRLVARMNEEAFGQCTNIGECEAVCPKGIRLEVIARMNRDFLKSSVMARPKSESAGGVG